MRDPATWSATRSYDTPTTARYRLYRVVLPAASTSGRLDKTNVLRLGERYERESFPCTSQAVARKISQSLELSAPSGCGPRCEGPAIMLEASADWPTHATRQ